jgi:uncharacterized delta-60 repeat protein
MTIIFLTPLLLFAQIENWVFTYNGTANGDDGARAVTYGADGNIYAAGQTLAQDYPSGNPEFAVISLTQEGDTNWVYRYNGPWGYDAATDVVYGNDGYIYAAGISDNWGYATDLVLMRLDAFGTADWVYRYYGNPSAGARAIAYGDDGNIYVVGWNYVSQWLCHFLVISLAATGDTNWIYNYGNSGDVNFGSSIVYGPDGNIYAAGSGTSADTTSDFLVMSLTTTGDTNWTYTYSGSANCSDAAHSLVYGGDGNIYAAGYHNSTSYLDGDFLVISLTPAGDTNWVYTHSGPTGGSDVFQSIAYGADDNIYATGYCNSTGGNDGDLFVISLTSAGDTNWSFTYDGYGADEGSAIVYGADSNIYIAGHTHGWSFQNSTYLVMSLTTEGSVNWIYMYGVPGISLATSIVLGTDGRIYTAGSGTMHGTGTDFTVISLSPGTGVEEGNQAICSDHEIGSTVIRGTLRLPEGKNCKVFDITGRVVQPSKITCGIYFIEVDGIVTQKVVKIR